MLRTLEAGDEPALAAICGDASLMQFALWGRPLTGQEARVFIECDFARDADDITKLGVLCLRAEPGVIGFAGLLPCKYLPGELEFGFVLATHVQGRGLASEIGRKLLDVGLRQMERERLYALCDPRNLASRAVLSRKLGMQFVRKIDTPDRGSRLVFEQSREGLTGVS